MAARRRFVTRSVFTLKRRGFCESGPGDASLVREGSSSDDAFSENIPAHSRTSPHKSSWIPVGVNLFAKALFQTQKMHRLHRPLREQVRPRPSARVKSGRV
ncbi:hypothetical protein CUB86_06675 [Pseudomonas syringae pv. actinidiae]|nr:hypothetical protein CUB86_06675 [Pseudomonas syringae pv. actinidiae]